MAKINVRSPYYVYYNLSNLESATLKLWIYTGTQGSRPVTPTYVLSASAVNFTVNFEIAELVRDYMTYNADDYETEIVWVDYQITRTAGGVSGNLTLVDNKAFYGYGYFQEGINPQNDSGLLQSNLTVVKLDDAPATIPVDTSKTTQVTYELNGELVYTKAITSSNENDEQIEYVTNGVNGSDEFEDRVIQDGGTFEGSSCLEQFANDFTLFDFDTIYIDTDDGVIKLTVENVEECKFDPYKITFVNKFGALQDLWFFKRTNETLSTKTEKFKRNIVVGGSYDTSRHQQKILTKNGSEKLTLNTGFYPEEYNDVFKQMQLSEDCWIEINSQTLPINVSSSSLNYKTHLNDKLINYTITIDYAFDTINNIR